MKYVLFDCVVELLCYIGIGCFEDFRFYFGDVVLLALRVVLLVAVVNLGLTLGLGFCVLVVLPWFLGFNIGWIGCIVLLI